MSLLDLDHWREIRSALAGNKLRTFLTAFGVFWGIFLLVVMSGSGTGLQNGATRGFADAATNSFFLWGQRASKPYRGMLPGRTIQLTTGDADAIRAIPEVAVVAPRNQLGGYQGGNNVTRGRKAGAFSVMGDHPEVQMIEPVTLVRGRFLNPRDVAERRKIAVIGTRVREVLFAPGEEAIGEHVRINGVAFKVVGVFRSKRSGEDAAQDAQRIFVPFSTYQQAFHAGDRVGWFAITSRHGVPVSRAEETVLELLRQRHRVAPDDERAFGHFNLEEEFDKIQGLFAGIHGLVWIVGIGTLAAGVIGVSNIMLIIVRERTREIGIRRAVGATPASIAGQVVLEAVLLTAVAGYVGLIAGMGLVELTRMLLAGAEAEMFVDPDVSVASALRALVILVVAGALAGLMPARRAIRVSPVEALRAG